ncbi:putative short-chain dehydrogenase/reductase family protein [Cercophora newfieldiana]|uniref:Short-chain dehydrogenase/reductase family protein n=1 Tax=Cercophora newfieldiana TaxID=92897 RepID=A0AA39YDI1_9PEZI|nr:putative short-chain dehydrogenase/reductase family protein [Cercophora newfieldiana]
MTGPTPQRRNLPLLATKDECAGRTYIVTGANTGLGFEAAKHLVALGSAKVILAVRNVNAGNEAKAKIDSETNTTDVAEVWYLDLANYDSVKDFANKAVSELRRIDGLIQNASVASIAEEPLNGQDANVSINVVGTFLLAVHLLPKLSETARQHNSPSHLVFVSSSAGFEVLELWNLIKDDPFVKIQAKEVGPARYPLSKLIETFATRELAALAPVSRTGVIVNIVCPGICITDLDRSAPPEFRNHLAEIRAKIGRTAEDGSRTLLHGVSAGDDTHGLFLHSCEVHEADIPEWVTNEDGRLAQKKVWEVVTEELERIDPACTGKVTAIA